MSKDHLELESLSAYLDGELDAHERSAVEEHLLACGECSATHSRLSTAAGRVSTLPRVEMTADEHRELRQAILRSRKPRVAWWRKGFLQWAAAGSLVVIAVTAIGLGFLREGDRGTAGSDGVTEAAAPPRPPDFDFGSGREVDDTVTSLPEVASAAGAPFRPEDDAKERVRSQMMARTDAEGSGAAGPPPEAAAAPPPESAQDVDPYAGNGQAMDRALGGREENSAAATSGLFSEEAGRACARRVGSTQAYPMVPLLVREATYQGTPAWLLVFAWSAQPVAGQPLDQLQSWLVTPQDCVQFRGPELESRALYRSFSDPT